MKQLLLYFMFFVGSSLVFVECARLFPTTAETSAHKPDSDINKEAISINERNVLNTLNTAAGLNGEIDYYSVNDLVGGYIIKAKRYRR